MNKQATPYTQAHGNWQVLPNIQGKNFATNRPDRITVMGNPLQIGTGLLVARHRNLLLQQQSNKQHQGIIIGEPCAPGSHEQQAIIRKNRVSRCLCHPDNSTIGTQPITAGNDLTSSRTMAKLILNLQRHVKR